MSVLSELIRGTDLVDLVAGLTRSEDPRHPHSAEPLVELAASALQLADASRERPVQYEGLRERFLPEVEFSGRVEHRNSQYMLYAAAVLRGGVEPDFARDIGWWQAPQWRYALYALVIYLRVAAERRATTVAILARELLDELDD